MSLEKRLSALEERAKMERARVTRNLDGEAVMSTAEISARIGLPLNQKLISALGGVKPAGKGRQVILWRVRDIPAICAGLIQHLDQVGSLVLADCLHEQVKANPEDAQAYDALWALLKNCGATGAMANEKVMSLVGLEMALIQKHRSGH